jgi:hypothetical protein
MVCCPSGQGGALQAASEEKKGLFEWRFLVLISRIGRQVDLYSALVPVKSKGNFSKVLRPILSISML